MLASVLAFAFSAGPALPLCGYQCQCHDHCSSSIFVLGTAWKVTRRPLVYFACGKLGVHRAESILSLQCPAEDRSCCSAGITSWDVVQEALGTAMVVHWALQGKD